MAKKPRKKYFYHHNEEPIMEAKTKPADCSAARWRIELRRRRRDSGAGAGLIYPDELDMYRVIR